MTTSIFSGFTNQYELSKTLRFGLSHHQENSDIEKNNSHQKFRGLVKNSFDRVKKNITEDQKKDLVDEKSVIGEIEKYVEENKKQLESWKEISQRPDVIKFSREYLKVLSRKANFDFNKRISLNLNGIKNKTVLNSIEKYFAEVIDKNEIILERFEPLIEQFKEAVENANNAHLKPNKIDFQKQFLSLLRVSGEWLNPLRNNRVEIIIKDNQKTEEKNKTINDFESKEGREKRSALYATGKSIRNYIEANGKQVPFAKCTLNYYTARQKPENVEQEITKLIKKLEIKELYTKIENLSNEEIEGYFENQKFLDGVNKLEFFNALSFENQEDAENYVKNNEISAIELAQIFKPKPIPASVKFALIDRLVEKEKYDREKLETLFDVIGEKVDIANDFKYAQENNTLDDFSLEHYPLKLAFDYAWENLAKHLQNRLAETKFAKEQCITFLNKFGIDDYENHSNLKLYSSLSFIRDELATLEHGNPNDRESIILNIKRIFETTNLPKNAEWTRDKIINVLNNENKLNKNANFQKSKSSIGLIRGGLKNKVRKYKNLTNNFKEIAGFLGKNFADLRDKLREECQFNKISHYAVLLEDSNDKYLLALEIDKKNELEEKQRNDRLDILEDCLQGEKTSKDDVLVKKISSFTSKTLNKILRNKGGYKDFHNKYSKFQDLLQHIYYYDFTKHLQIIGELKDKLCENGNKIFDRTDKKTGKTFYKQYRCKNNKELLNYIKTCLTDSQMSKSQNWNEKFNWEEDLKNCNTYEDIEKVLDIKGYCIEEKYISKENINNLVNNKNCLLFPIGNQDYSSQALEKKEVNFASNKNQFTQDFEEAITFKNNTEKFRLHPECTLFYKFPSITPEIENKTLEELKNNHKAKILNRNMRFQILGNFGVEKKTTIENKENFVSRNAKNKLLRKKEEYENNIVKPFNKKINDEIKNGERNYFYGIDRGIKELATLCVLDKKNKIQDFIVFQKEKTEEKVEVLSRLAKTGDKERKVYRYTKFEKQSILDLTNIKVETWHCADENHPNSEFLKEAFNEIEKDAELKKIAEKMGHNFSGESKSFTILVQYPEKEGSSALKLRMKHYQRLLAYSCSHSEHRKNLYENCAKKVFFDENKQSKYAEYSEIQINAKLEIIKNLFGLKTDFSNDENKISFFEELQTDKLKLKKAKEKLGKEKLVILFEPLFRQFFEWAKEYKKIGEEQYNNSEFKTKYAELDDLDNLKRGIVANMVGTINFLMETRKGVIVLEDVQKFQEKIKKNNLNQHEENTKSHSEAEHCSYAGTETYRYLEKMLVRKFEKQGLTPPFADLDSLNKITLEINGSEIKNKKQFGIFYYVPADYTSNICPECGFCICEKDKQNILPEFANPKTKEEINEYKKIPLKNNVLVLEKDPRKKQGGLADLSLLLRMKNTLEIKQIEYLKEGNVMNIKKANKVNGNIRILLVPRLKARKDMYQWKKIKDDPFFCAGCGKNTDADLEENFDKNFTSADDIAAYNVAYSICYNFTK